MKLISVNVGAKREIVIANETETTGIYKEAVTDAVQIGELGLLGDHIDDKRNHGGVDQAVYVYGGGDYAWWSAQLGRELPPGQFGENLTVSELESADMNIGDTLQVGAVVLQVTSPRIPCVVFATKMGDPEWVKKFRHAERPGLYCRVLTQGAVMAGDAVSVTPYTQETLTIREMFRKWYDRNYTEEELRHMLAAPIDVRSRRYLKKRLVEMVEPS